ncbi:MAG: dual specificity protein phosphatase family protein [Deltaproteobacteria bacterium]|nr:MAG: dual specificity protein phosphatase family protein [Deltaproteobacteria bacterium]
MSLFDRLTTRVLALLGLDFDLSFDNLSEPFHAIAPQLTLGARPRPERVEALRELGITHVVSCLPEAEREAMGFLAADFETLFLPVHDGIGEDIDVHFPVFFALLDGLGRGERALVHCEVGVSRSATMVVAHVMQARQLRFYEAYREVRSRRPQVLPNVGFASQLQAFEGRLFPEPRDGHASLTRYLHEVCHVPVEVDVLQAMLEDHDFDAVRAIRSIFGDEVPRVVQGVRT